MRLSKTIRVLAVAKGVEVLARKLVRRVVQQLGHPAMKKKLCLVYIDFNRYIYIWIEQSVYSLWLAMCYPEVKVDARDKHIGLEPNFVYARWRKCDRQANHPHERRCRFPRVAERVLRPQSTQQQNDLRKKKKFFSHSHLL